MTTSHQLLSINDSPEKSLALLQHWQMQDLILMKQIMSRMEQRDIEINAVKRELQLQQFRHLMPGPDTSQ